MTGFEERMVAAARQGDWGGLATALRQGGYLSGPSLEKGAVVAVRVPGDAQISVGRVAHVDMNQPYLWLSDCSWIDHTGELYSDGMSKGATANGWSSEYEGDAMIVLGTGVKITLLEKSFALPTESVRPNRA